MCVSKVKMGLVGSVWFMGWVITLPFIPRLADIYGRRKLVCIALACHFPLIYGVLACQSFNAILAIGLCFGLLNSVRFNIGFIYMQELFPMKAQAFFGTLWRTVEASIMLFASLYFEFS